MVPTGMPATTDWQPVLPKYGDACAIHKRVTPRVTFETAVLIIFT